MSLRRWEIALGALAVAIAVVLALVGVALRSVAAQARADDRVLANAAGSTATASHERTLSVRVGETLLGLRDDRAFRDAVAISKAADTQRGTAVLELRARAEAILFPLIRTSDDNVLRSRASNLLGALLFEDAKSVRRNPHTYLEQALGAFQDAVRFDPSNVTAKINLELLATLPEATRFRPQGNAGSVASATPDSGGGY
jgi:hypothetical protein